MSYDGSIKIDTKIDTEGFSSGIGKLKSIASTGATAISAAIGTITTGITAAATASIAVGSSFEEAMSKVSAISGATGKDLEALEAKAKEMGATTKFSASESAQAMQYMAMAGWDTEAMLSGIGGIMNLAAADGLDLATTSDIVTDALTAFGLQASDSSHFADVLAKASSSANTNVSMLGESFKYVAPLAGTMGYSVEDMSVALGLMANASIKGSQAGTSLKTALANLASPTKEMQEIMDKYNISLTDADGKAKPFIDTIKDLREKFGGLSESEQAATASTLFGKEAMSGMLAIINASDSDFNNLVSSIANADGAAQSMADTMQNNLKGQITILKSGLEGLGIEIYEQMSEPLTGAAIEAQNYVSQLTEAFKSDGIPGLIEEAGNIFGELAVKAAEQAPKMFEAAINFLKAFIEGIANNKSQLISAAKQIVDTLANSLISLLPPSIQGPLKEIYNSFKKNFESVMKVVNDFIKSLKDSFNNGGLKSAVNTLKNIIIKFGDAVSSIVKAVLPLLAKVIDKVASSMKVWLPIVTGLYTAFKAYSIITTITNSLKLHTAAVTAESLAEAASTGAITLKQIAVGVLTGEIGLATAAQWAWNIAMEANPIGLIVAAIGGLIAGVGALSAALGDADDKSKELAETQEKLKEKNEEIGNSYETIGGKFTSFLDDVKNAGSIFDNFNEEILISSDEKQALDDNMTEVQREITDICRSHAKDRAELTGGEIERLDELFTKMHELTEQELEIEKDKQDAVVTQAKALNNAAGLSLDEYNERAKKLINSADETKEAVIDKAYEQYSEEIVLLDKRLESDQSFSQEDYNNAVQAAEDKYNATTEAAKREAADTIDIIQQGYIDRADVMNKYTDELNELHDSEENETTRHNDALKDINDKYNQEVRRLENEGLDQEEINRKKWDLFRDKQKKEEEENNRHSQKILSIRNSQQVLLDDENYQNQVSGFGALEALYETYSGKTNERSTDIVNAFFEPMKNMPDDTKEAFVNSMKGGIEGLTSMAGSLANKAAELANSFIGTFTRMFDEHSPSKLFKKIFGYTIEGGIEGLDQETPDLLKNAKDIGQSFTDKMTGSISTEGFVSQMKNAVASSRAILSDKLTSRLIQDINMHADDKPKYILKGDLKVPLEINGREFAVATASYMSEELAWEGDR